MIKELEVACLSTGTMILKYNVNKKFKTVITGREQWKDGAQSHATLEYRWLKDEQGVGAGLFRLRPRTKISLSI